MSTPEPFDAAIKHAHDAIERCDTLIAESKAMSQRVKEAMDANTLSDLHRVDPESRTQHRIDDHTQKGTR